MPFISSALGRFVYLGSTNPLQITNVSFSNISNSGFRVNWTGGFGATSYVYKLNGITTSPSSDQGVLSNYAVFSGLNSLVNYVINITPYNASGNSPFNLFSPLLIPGLSLWLDAADPNNNSTLPANGSSITNWTDKSGFGRTGVSQNGSTTTIVYNSQNGLPAINMYNTTLRADIPSGTFISELDVFIVYKYAYNSQSRVTDAPFISRNSGPSSGGNYGPPNAPLHIETGVYCTCYGQYSYNGQIIPYYYSTSTTLFNINVSQATQATSQLTGFYNGSQILIKGPGSGWVPYDTATIFEIGRGGTPINIYLYEVLLFNKPLSVSNRQKLEGYLAWKWGINNLLPNIHPYFLYSSQPSATTTTLAPTSLVFSNVTDTSFQVNWTGSANITSYTYTLNGVLTTPTIDMGVSLQYAIFTGLLECNVYSLVIKASNLGSSGINPAVPPLPNTISGLQNWYDAADPLGTGTAPANDRIITTWYDKSGYGRNSTSSSGNITLADDGYKYLNFDGSSYYSIPQMSWIYNVNFTIFIIETPTSPFNMNILSGGTPFNMATSIGWVDSRLFFRNNNGGDTATYPGTQLPTNAQRMWSITLTNNTTYQYNLNGQSISLNGVANMGNVTHSGFNTIGASSWDIAGQPKYTGKIREIIAFSGTVSSTDIQKVEGYLAQKWGLQLSLPTNHPYFNVSGLYSSASFSPASPTSATMQIWYDAADPLNTGVHLPLANSVSVWYDKSSNSANATAGSAAIYRRDGRYYMDCSGSYYNMPSTSMNWTIGNYFTIFIVETITSYTQNSTGNSLLGGTTGGSNQLLNIVYKQNTYNSMMFSFYNDDTYYYMGIVLGETHIWSFVFNNVSGATKRYIYLNGNLVGSSNANTLNAFTGPTIGASFGNYGTNAYFGRYREIIGYQGNLNTADRQQTEGYLAQKWSSQSVLPLSHPYYNVLSTPLVVTATFSPLYITGLQNWYDSSDPLNTNSAPAIGTSIATWYDKSGYGRNSTSTSGNITLANDGYNYLNFSYSYFNIPEMTWMYNQYFTVFMVETTATFYGGGMNYIAASSVGGVDQGLIFVAANNTNVQWGIYQDNKAEYQPSSPYLQTGVTRIWSLTFTPRPTTYTFTIYLNGVSVATKNAVSALTGRAFSQIGSGQGNSSANWYNGKMREILAYKGNVSSMDRQKIEGYLAWKWGLQTSLSASHPYYYSSPTPSTNIMAYATNNMLLASNNSDTGLNSQTCSQGGSVTYATIGGKLCAYFNNSTSNYLAYPFSIPQIFTITYWFYAINANSAYTPWATADSPNSSCYGISADTSIDVSGAQHFYLNTSGSGVQDAGNENWAQSFFYPVVSGTWYFVALSINVGSSGMAKSYMNGVLINVRDFNGYLYCNSWLILGKNCDNSRAFNGYLRNFMVFNRELTENEIRSVYSQTNTFIGATSAETYLPLTINSTDIGMNPQTVTINGTITYTNIGGKACAYFNNSTSNYLSIPFTSSNVFTIAYWFYATDSNLYDPWSLSSTSTGTAYGINSDIQAGLQKFNIVLSGGTINSGNFSYNTLAGTWYFVTLTINGNTAKSYVNGSLMNSIRGSGTLLNRSYLLLGKSGDNSRAFNGYLKNFMFFKSELPADDVATLYNQMNTPITTTLSLSYGTSSKNIIITLTEQIYVFSSNCYITKETPDINIQTLIFNNNNSGSGLISGLPNYNSIECMGISPSESSLHLGVNGSGVYSYLALSASPSSPGGYTTTGMTNINIGAQFSGAILQEVVVLSDSKVYGYISSNRVILILNGTATQIVMSGETMGGFASMVYGGTNALGQDILYLSDITNHRIKQLIVTSSTAGTLMTIIGGGSSPPSRLNTYGTSVSLQLNSNSFLAYYSRLNILFFIDTSNSVIRVYMPGTSNGVGQISTLNTSTSGSIPTGITRLGIDSSLGVLYLNVSTNVYRYLITSLITDRGYIPIFILNYYQAVSTLSTSGGITGGTQDTDLSISSSGIIYVTQFAESIINTVNTTNGVVSYTGNIPSDAIGIWGSAVDPDGNIYCVKPYANKLLKLNSSGSYISTYTSLLLVPVSVFADKHGNVYVVNQSINTTTDPRITKYDQAGNASIAVVSSIVYNFEGAHNQIQWATIDTNGSFYIAISVIKKIMKITGGVASYVPNFTAPANLGQMGIDVYGYIFAVCNNTSTSTYNILFIDKITGSIVYTYTDTNYINGVTVDSVGNIWFATNGLVKVLRRVVL